MDERAAALTSQVTNAPRERRWPNQRPRNAATLIVIDREQGPPRVLMGKRHHGHKFMPGKFVFPGGRIELADRHMDAASELAPRVDEALSRRVTGRTGGLGRPLAMTALRETYEETGLLIGRKAAPAESGGRSRAADPAWDAFRRHGVLPDLERMTFIGRAITPPRRPKRFDTRFFAIDKDALCAEVPGVVGPDSELVEVTWVDLAAARRLDLPPITHVMLNELEHRIANGFGHDLPVPFYFEVRGRFSREEL